MPVLDHKEWASGNDQGGNRARSLAMKRDLLGFRTPSLLVVLFGLILLTSVLPTLSVRAARPGENLALGRPYQLAPRPNYGPCTDPGDATDLTDGKHTNG